MATQNNQQREIVHKFFLSKWFIDAGRVVEPQEKDKKVVAGMVEAAPAKKEYPDTYIKRTLAVLGGETGTMFKTTFMFLLMTLFFIGGVIAGDYYLQQHILGGNYNFMASIGVGYPGGGDNIAESVSVLYSTVKLYVILIGAGGCIIAAPFLSGLMYAAKRVFFQDTYKFPVKVYFHGFAKHWWKYLVCGTLATGTLVSVGKAILELLSAQQLGIATALDYCLAIIPAVIAFPILLILFTMMGLFVTHDLTFKQVLQNSIVLLVNNYIAIPVAGIVTLIPLVGFFCMGQMVTMMTYLLMVFAGFFLIALMWVAVVDRGMLKAHILKGDAMKRAAQEARKANKFQEQHIQATKKKQQANKQQFQNPKKKKKK